MWFLVATITRNSLMFFCNLFWNSENHHCRTKMWKIWFRKKLKIKLPKDGQKMGKNKVIQNFSLKNPILATKNIDFRRKFSLFSSIVLIHFRRFFDFSGFFEFLSFRDNFKRFLWWQWNLYGKELVKGRAGRRHQTKIFFRKFSYKTIGVE